MPASTPENKLEDTIKQLRSDLEDLRKGGYIPRLENDPEIATGITLWMLHDGRLRGRLADGTIQEWAKVDHTHPGISGTPAGAGVSTVPPPPPAYVPVAREYFHEADWSQAYWQNGTEVYANARNLLYYSQYTAATGQLKSMIHFPSLDELDPGPQGIRIAEVWLRLSNVHTNPNSGTVLTLGLHNAGALPGSFQQIEAPPLQIHVGKPSPDVWYRLPEWVGERLSNDQATGITLNQNSTNRALYGYASGVGGPLSPPALKIVHVK